MEPMNLGSAPSSPASPGINPSFLPNFLMGGELQHSASGNTSIVSPGRGSRVPPTRKTPDRSTYSSSFSALCEKTGPPNTSLFESVGGKGRPPSSPIMTSTLAHSNESPLFGESFSRISPEHGKNVTFGETFHKRPSRNGNPEKIDSHWVTVFGFPPSALNTVLSYLSTCGPVAERRIPSQGNWIHVKFNNLSEVCRAVALNGRIINNNTMIGVVLYYNKDDKENNSTMFTSPMTARSLRHSYVSPHNPNSVISPQNVPQKSTGIVTKAMEYVFGW